MPVTPSPAAEALLQAQLKLGAVQSSLEAANASATAVEAMLIAPIIRQAAELRERIAAVRMAMRETAEETGPAQADALRLRTAVQDVLLGSRQEADGTRRTDSLSHVQANAVTDQKLHAWASTLERALDGLPPEPRP